jgi:hypothetical protein
MISRITIVDIGGAESVSRKKAQESKCLDRFGTGSRQYEPVGACYIASMLVKCGYDVGVVIRKGDNVSLDEILDGDPQVIGFSALTYNYPLIRELAILAKKCRLK